MTDFNDPHIDDLLEQVDRFVEDMALSDAITTMERLAYEIQVRLGGLRNDAREAGL